MEKKSKAIWFEDSNQINCKIKDVEDSITNLGKHFTELISLMPGMKEVALIEQGADYVKIKTNEGLMTRREISITKENEHIILEFNEEYQAGKTVNTNAHFFQKFEFNGNVINHHLVISDLTAPGFMGFLYKNFGSSNMGKAFLETYKTYFEE